MWMGIWEALVELTCTIFECGGLQLATNVSVILFTLTLVPLFILNPFLNRLLCINPRHSIQC